MIHVFAAKWRLERKHFIDHTAHGPDIALVAIRLVSPDLWRCIVRCSCLGVIESLITSDFADIHVTNFRLVQDSSITFTLRFLIFAEEYVR